MDISKKPDHINIGLFTFINDLIQAEIGAPSLTLNAAMDVVFNDEDWWTYEYETILQTLETYGFSLPNVHVLGQIQALSAARNGESLIDKEWHLFEKVCLALTGIPVLFFDKQNVPIEHVHHAMKLLKIIGSAEFSEEVKHYIGSEAINDEILWHPNPEIDTCINYSIGLLESAMGIDKKELDNIREATSKRFNDAASQDLVTVKFDDTSVEDMMCLRLFRSIVLGKELSDMENSALAMFTSLRNGDAVYDGESYSFKPSESVIEEGEDPTSKDPGEIIGFSAEELSSDLTPDVVDMEEAVKLAAKELLNSEDTLIFSDLVSDPISSTASATTNKTSAMEGVPIDTGVPMGGEEDDSEGPSSKLEKTSPDTGPEEEEEHTVDNTFAFEL